MKVKAEIVNLHKLGSYAKLKAHPDKPRLTFVKFKNTWDARIILARAEGKQDVLEKGRYLYSTRLNERRDIKRKGLFEKKPRELLSSGVARENLKSRNFLL